MLFTSATAAVFLIRRRRRCFAGGFFFSSLSSLPWSRSLSTQTQTRKKNYNNSETCSSRERERERKQQPPWLVLSSPHTPESRYLYDLSLKADQQGLVLNREIILPDIAEQIFIGSSHGFLFSFDISPNPTVRATNPLTGAHLPIPPVSLIPYGCISATGDPKITITWKKPLDIAKVGLNFSALYGAKVALSPSLDKAILLASDGTLSFARLDDHTWTQLPHTWNDFIFHKGLLYTIYGYHAIGLGIFDLDSDDPLSPSHLTYNFDLPVGYNPHQPDIRLSLVESPDGNDLFFVLRRRGRLNEDIAIRPRQTNSCRVFKLVQSNRRRKLAANKNNKWTRVRDIGDTALFVGSNSSSFSLSVADFPSLKPNSVYFNDSWEYDDHSQLLPDEIGDAGVFDLQNRGIQFFQLSDGLRQLNWPRPVWYMPSI